MAYPRSEIIPYDMKRFSVFSVFVNDIDILLDLIGNFNGMFKSTSLKSISYV
jgi:hypothetical protein